MNCCEEVGILKTISNFGVGFFGENRTIVMIVADVLVVLSFILTCVALAGCSNDDEDNVKDGAWSVVEVKSKWGGGTIYYGTRMAVYKNTKTKYENCGGSLCNDCDEGGQTALNSTAFLFLFVVSLMISSASRTRAIWDMVLHKIAAIVAGSLALLVCIIAMGSWNDQCQKEIKDNLNGTGTLELGPGMNSMIATFFFVFFALLIHILTPLAAAAGGEGGGEEAKPTDNQA